MSDSLVFNPALNPDGKNFSGLFGIDKERWDAMAKDLDTAYKELSDEFTPREFLLSLLPFAITANEAMLFCYHIGHTCGKQEYYSTIDESL